MRRHLLAQVPVQLQALAEAVHKLQDPAVHKLQDPADRNQQDPADHNQQDPADHSPQADLLSYRHLRLRDLVNQALHLTASQ